MNFKLVQLILNFCNAI